MISIIAALAENGVIGVDNRLPWHLPEDLKRFKRLTMGHHLIMGRRNYESIGHPLPGRVSIVVTHRNSYTAPGCLVAHSLEEAFEAARGDPEAFVIGGAEIYAQSLPRVQRLYLTLVHATVPGDTYFPDFDRSRWREVERERHEADARHPFAYSFVTLERKPEPRP